MAGVRLASRPSTGQSGRWHRRVAREKGKRMEGFREFLGITVGSHGDGEARLTLPASERHLNPGGAVHGGAITTLIDTAMGEALATRADDAMPVTVEIKVNFLEPAREGDLVATARVRRQGKRFTLIESEVVQADTDEHVAYGTGTFTTVG